MLLLSLCASTNCFNSEITHRVLAFLDKSSLCVSARVSKMWHQFIYSYLTHLSNPLPEYREPINKRRLITENPQLLCIYTGKKGQELKFMPVAEKIGGTALGTVFEKVSIGTTKSRWIGKVGNPNGQFRKDPNTIRTRTTKEINLDSMREKLASDLYQELGRGIFAVPKTRLSVQKIVDPFTESNALAQHWNIFGIPECLRVMSRFVEGYYDFEKAKTRDSRSTLSFMDYIERYQRPPETLLTPKGISVPLRGIMGLLAVGRILADIDLLGGRGGNAGFFWVEENGVIIAAQTVKIDPGYSFSFSDLHTKEISPNLVINTHRKAGPPQYHLEDKRDLQTSTSNRDTIVQWNALSAHQREEFLAVFLHCMRYIDSDEVFRFLFHRDNLFSLSEKALFPENVATQMLIEIKEWMALQLALYAKDLQTHKLKHPEQLIRALYADCWGELTEKTFPVNRIHTFMHLITLQNLFPSHAHKQKVWLRGKEGIDTSTLCKQIAHKWATGHLWSDRFHMVYYLSLTQLSRLSLDHPALVLKQAITQLFPGKTTSLLERLPYIPQNTLVILDGYNEATLPIKNFVKHLLENPQLHILLTSGSNAGELEALMPHFDCRVESTGTHWRNPPIEKDIPMVDGQLTDPIRIVPKPLEEVQATVGILLQKVLDFLDHQTIQQDNEAYSTLAAKAQILINLNPKQNLSTSEQEFLHWTALLLDTNGKVRSFVRNQLMQPQSPTISEPKSLTQSNVIYPIVSSIKPHLSNPYPISTPTSSSKPFTINNSSIIETPQSKSISSAKSPLLPFCAFGAAQWEKYFGDVGIEPPLPPDIHQILQGPCPILPGKTVEQTHMLVLIPATIDGQPFTFKTLGELIKNPKTGPATEFKYLKLGEYQDNPAAQSYWILMSRDVLEGSRKHTYKTQFDQVATLAKKTKIPYAVPKVLEAATCILMNHVSTGQKFYTDDPWTFTRCQEFYEQKNDYKLVVGGFGSGGLGVYCLYWVGYDSIGVSVCRKFGDFIGNKLAQPQSSSISEPKSLTQSNVIYPIVSSIKPHLSNPYPISTPTNSSNPFNINNSSLIQTLQPKPISTTTSPLLPFCAFGAAQWEKYFGDVGIEPPLPPDIHQILQGPCHILPGKTVEQTHMLVLIPATINGKPFTFKTLGELIKNPKTGPATKFKYFDLGEYQDSPVPQSYWLLMSRDVLEGSRNKNYKTQFDQVATLAKKTGIPYAAPKVLEAATCILMYHVSTGQKFYTDDPFTLTRCQEFYDQKKDYKLGVGGFGSGGLCVNYYYWVVLDYLGVSVCRKF